MPNDVSHFLDQLLFSFTVRQRVPLQMTSARAESVSLFEQIDEVIRRHELLEG
jgi:hypothetical protein